MSHCLFTKMPRRLCRLNTKTPLCVLLMLGLFGCSSVKTPETLKKLSLPNISISENDPSFRKRMYVGGSFGQSILKPDTSNTVFTASENSAVGSDFRLGIDLHNQLSVELNTSLLGKIDFDQSNELVTPDMSYTSASVSALIYGLTGVSNRSRREGFSGYGRIGYGLVQHASIVEPFDYRDNSVLLGLGAEYGFNNGLALRAEVTRIDDEATFLGFGGVYRFGLAPKQIGQVFVDAAKPVLGAANAKTVVHNGKTYRVNNVSEEDGHALTSVAEALAQAKAQQSPQLWKPKTSRHDLDGDGVVNSLDQCENTIPNTTVGTHGCGMFDSVLSNVTFKRGSSWLTPKARGELDELVVTLLAFPEARIQVRAHTDSDGPADLNMDLSTRRAESVVAYLSEKGVSELQLVALGLGEEEPIDTNETEASKKRNRRVELLTLTNVHQSHFANNAVTTNNVPMLGAANPAAPKTKTAAAEAVTKAVNFVPKEPVFPPMAAAKIDPLPNSTYIAGMSLGGILHGVDFDTGSAKLTLDATSRLDSVSNELKAFPDAKLVIMAHTDDQLSEEESLDLTAQQASSVVNYLVSTGIAAQRLQAEGFGSSLPLAQNVTDRDRQRNRRVEIRVIQ